MLAQRSTEGGAAVIVTESQIILVKATGEVKKTAVESVHATISKEYIVAVDVSRRLSIYNLTKIVENDDEIAPVR